MLAPVVTFDERDCWPDGGMRGETQLMHAVERRAGSVRVDCLGRPGSLMRQMTVANDG
jgi:hypothetical protein